MNITKIMDNNSVASTNPVYTLSIAADLSGIPVHSIRQYIDKGLMIPFKKESNRNLFSRVDVLRLKFIQKLLKKPQVAEFQSGQWPHFIHIIFSCKSQ